MTETVATPEYRMTTGKHRGELISAVPRVYLEFIVGMRSHWDQDAARAELKRRGPAPAPRIAYTADELEAHAKRITRCRSCEAPVVFLTTGWASRCPSTPPR